MKLINVILWGIPAILVLHFVVMANYPKNHKFEKIIGVQAKVMLFLIIGWFIICGYLLFSPEEKEVLKKYDQRKLDSIESAAFLRVRAEDENNSTSKYSVSAIEKANDRVEKWQLRGHLKLDINAGKAYVNNLLWTVANVEQKTEIMATVMMYTENKYGKEERITRFYNYSTGKQIAEWGPIGGYDFDY